MLGDWLRRLLGALGRRDAGDAAEPATADEARNPRLLRLEGVFASLVFGGVQAFYALYVVRVGGSNAVIGWISSAPALVSLLWQIPCSRLMVRFRSFRTPVLAGVIGQRLCVMALAGVVFLPAAWQPWGIVVLVAVAALPTALWGVAFQSSWVGMFSPRRLASAVGLRWSVASITITIAVFVLGKGLDLIRYPLNFQLLFAGVGTISLLSVAVMLRFRFPLTRPPACPGPAAPRPAQPGILELLRRHSSFTLLEITAFVAYLSVYGAVPLFRIYWLRDLEANGTWLGALAAAASIGSALGTWLFGRLSHPLHNRRNQVIACLGAAVLYPACTAAFHSLGPLVVVNLLAGIVLGGNELMLLNRAMELAPREHLPTFVAVYATTIQAATFVAPLLTTALADFMGSRSVLLVVAGMGLAGAVLIYKVGWGRSVAGEGGAA